MSDQYKGLVTVNVMTVIQGLTEEDKKQIGEELVEVILEKLKERAAQD